MYEARQRKKIISHILSSTKRKDAQSYKMNNQRIIQRFIHKIDFQSDDCTKEDWAEINEWISKIGGIADRAILDLEQDTISLEAQKINAVASLIRHWKENTNTPMSAGTAVHQMVYAKLEQYGVSTEIDHMDILVTLQSGHKVVFDITSVNEAKKHHAKERHYEKNDNNIVAVVEIGYQDTFSLLNNSY